MTKTTVAAYVYEAPYVHVHVSTPIAFDSLFPAQDVPDTSQVPFGQVFDTRIPLDACLLCDILRLSRPYPVYGAKRNLHPLIVRNIYTSY